MVSVYVFVTKRAAKRSS